MAIAATNAFANECGLSVKADEGATYSISQLLFLYAPFFQRTLSFCFQNLRVKKR
jgi:hypothetical protein